ncbi:cytochrome b [Phaeospirillum tilakii]|uniref:Cytochrome b n=1 Tax=Phaeospirillum tilakii TaxID=741673 RepID=A0ABW5CEU3_9PROT
MSSPLPEQKYSTAIRIIHWVRAALIVGLLAVGLLMVSLPDDMPEKFAILYPNHKQFGILALLLVLTQLLLRRIHGVPEPVKLPPLEQTIFLFTHGFFYVLMIAVPVTGYCLSSSYPESDGIPFFLTSLPELLDKDQALSSRFAAVHSLLASGLLLLVALHVGGVLKHRLLDHGPLRRILDRML